MPHQRRPRVHHTASQDVTRALSSAFAGHEFPVLPVDLESGRVALAVVFPGIEIIPASKPATTQVAVNRPRPGKRTNTERHELYMLEMGSEIITAARKAFTAVPTLGEISVVITRKCTSGHEALYCGRFNAATVSDPVLAELDIVRVIAGGSVQGGLHVRGRFQELVPIATPFRYPDVAAALLAVSESKSQDPG